jgi:DNA-binding transcriptional MocR family regulator
LYGVNVIIVCMTIWTPHIQNSSTPLYKQVADGIEQDIFSGRLQPGDKMPTHRDLADAIGINVTTITRGYKEAEKRGLIAGTVGRGTYVASDAGTSTAMVSHEPHAPGMIEMGLVNPLYHLDPDLALGLKKLCRRRDVSALMHYSEPGGLPEHRATGADWANRFGFEVNGNSIVVCSGAQHGLTCALNGLFRPGDRIATDSLTYPGMKTLAAMLGLRLVPVEMDQSGMDADSLDRICRREQISGLYLMPGVHNPTTTTLSESRRNALAEIVLKHGLIVIEDDAYDLTRSGEVITPISALLPDNGIYITGISKALAAGLRVGFMVVPPRYRKPVCEAILNTTWMTPPLNVELVSMWIRDGVADTIVDLKRKEAAKRFVLAGEILRDYFFAGIANGFFIWLTLPAPWRGIQFEQRMRELGVNLFGAEKFTVGDARAPAAARISLTGTKSSEELATGLQLVKRVLDGEQQSDFPVTM